MYSIILHATDLKENHFDLCKQAVEIAKRFDATLHLLHVIESPSSLQFAQGLGFAELAAPVKDDALTVMKYLGEAMNIPQDRLHVEVGSIKLAVLEKARTLNCNLIIIGSHVPNHLPAFLGSTANAVIHHTPCDVLTVRTS